DVKLTALAVDMLYGASGAARIRARQQAFLACEQFRQTCVEIPKNQPHELSYRRGFAQSRLEILNEAERFQRLFLEAARSADLLEGELGDGATTVRLRPGDQEAAGRQVRPQPEKLNGDSGYEPVPTEEVRSILESLGLANYADRSEVAQKSSGDVVLKVAEGQ